jgi:hypothetical protein
LRRMRMAWVYQLGSWPPAGVATGGSFDLATRAPDTAAS